MSDLNSTFKSTLEITQALDRLHRERGFGERGSVYNDMLRGIDTMNNGTFVASNRDNKGYTFFTRPCLNLTYSNLSRVRRLATYRNSDEYSILRYCRVILDPWGQEAANNIPKTPNAIQGKDMNYYGGGKMEECVTTPLVDAKSPFINLIGNNLISLTGWPDPVVDYHTSQKGIMGEEHIMADGVYDRMGAFNLEVTLRNPEGNPFTLLFDLWETYMAEVKLGNMYPYDMFLLCQEIDYMTRCYRFVMDPTKTFITMWSACGAGFPINNAMGTIFNFDSEKDVSDGTQTLNFSFQCVGAMYNDPILFDEFNRLTSFFNPDLTIVGYDNNGKDNKLISGTKYIKLRTIEERRFFNYCAYPLVNENTYELEWWVEREMYKRLVGVKTNG